MARYNSAPTVEASPEVIIEEVPAVEETTPMEEVPAVEETTPVEEVPEVEETTPVEEVPAVDEVPVVDEVPEVITVSNDANILDVTKISALLAKPGILIREKLDDIKLNGTVPFKLLIAKLDSYNEIMSPNAPSLDATKGAGRNFDLYTVLKALISEDNYNVFKVKFDIVNLYFKEYRTVAYTDYMLFRHSEEWKWGKDNFTTYCNIITVITTLCDMSTRQDKLKTLSLDKAFNKTDTVLNDTAIENLLKYYKA